MIKISLIEVILIILIIRLKIQNPKTNNSLNLRKQLKRNNLRTIKVITHLLINMNRLQSKTVMLMMTSLVKHLMIVTKKIKLEATLVIIKSAIILYLR